jgi:hypothetical protein
MTNLPQKGATSLELSVVLWCAVTVAKPCKGKHKPQGGKGQIRESLELSLKQEWCWKTDETTRFIYNLQLHHCKAQPNETVVKKLQTQSPKTWVKPNNNWQHWCTVDGDMSHFQQAHHGYRSSFN